MYQFMVVARNSTNVTHGDDPTFTGSGTDVRDISIMSLTSGTNKWASRAVIALQLAAWSAVGIVLLEKGIASLQKMPGSFNASHEIQSPKSTIGNLSPDNVIPFAPDKDRAATRIEENESQKESAKNLVETTSLDANGDTIEARINNNTDRLVDENNRTVAQLNNGLLLKKAHGTMTMRTEFDNWNGKDNGEIEEESRWKGGKRSRFVKVVAGGAAAGAAMVAVGAIMLVLGPAVIILRTLDERRQERKFLKLSVVEDLPPSYEQVTGDTEQAPTYSSLNLDTIVTSPSSLHNLTNKRED